MPLTVLRLANDQVQSSDIWTKRGYKSAIKRCLRACLVVIVIVIAVLYLVKIIQRRQAAKYKSHTDVSAIADSEQTTQNAKKEIKKGKHIHFCDQDPAVNSFCHHADLDFVLFSCDP